VACCAFTLFVIAQIVAVLAAVGRRLGLSAAPGDAWLNPATAWQLHAAPAPTPPRPRARRRRLGPGLVLVGLLEVGLVAAGIGLVRGGPSADLLAQLGTTGWCGDPASLAEVATLRD
jgi:hypothetical protein